MASRKLDLTPSSADSLFDAYLASEIGGEREGLNDHGLKNWYSYVSTGRVDVLLDQKDSIGDSWFKAALFAMLLLDHPADEALRGAVDEVMARSANFEPVQPGTGHLVFYVLATAYHVLGDCSGEEEMLARGDAGLFPEQHEDWFSRESDLTAMALFYRCRMHRMHELPEFVARLVADDGDISGCEVKFDLVIRELRAHQMYGMVPDILRLQAQWGQHKPEWQMMEGTLAWMAERGDSLAQISDFLVELQRLAANSDIQRDELDPGRFEYALLDTQPNAAALFMQRLRDVDNLRERRYYLQHLVDLHPDNVDEAFAWVDANLDDKGQLYVYKTMRVLAALAERDQARALEYLARVASDDPKQAARLALSVFERQLDSVVWQARLRELMPHLLDDIRSRSGHGTAALFALWSLTDDASWVPEELEESGEFAKHLIRRACEHDDDAMFKKALALLKAVPGADRRLVADPASEICAEHGKWAWEQRVYASITKAGRQYWSGASIELLAKQGLGIAAAQLCDRRGKPAWVGLRVFSGGRPFVFWWEL